MRTLLFLLLQMCLNGKCVSEEENSLDYGGGGGDEFLQRTGTAIISTTFGQPPSPPLRFPPPQHASLAFFNPVLSFSLPPLNGQCHENFDLYFFALKRLYLGSTRSG